MVWLYEIANSKTGEIIKLYSKHSIASFKEICERKAFIYESWCGYIKSDGTIVKV